MANNWQLGMIAGLDGTQSRNQLNSDIKGLSRHLDKLKLYTEIDKNQVIQLQNQLKKLQIDLNTVTVTDAAINGLVQKINAGLQNIQISNINIGNIGNQAQQVGQQIGNNIAQGVQSGVTKAASTMKSFAQLADSIQSQDIIFNKDGLQDTKLTLDAIKKTYSEFGQVKITNQTFNLDELQSFKVNIEQVNGELKETRSFMMELNSEGTKFIFPDDVVKGTEKYVQHLNSAKNVINATGDEANALKQKLADQEKYYGNIKKEVNTLYSLKTKLLSADELETAELERQIKSTKQRITYNNQQIDKKGLRDNSLTREINDLEVAKQKQLALAEARLQDSSNAKSQSQSQKELNAALKEQQALSEQANKIQLSWQTEGYQSKVDSLIARTNQWVDANGNARISTESLQTALNNLGTAYTKLNSSGGNTVANQQALIAAEEALDTEVKKVQSSITSMNSTMAKSSAVDSLRQKVQMFYDTNTATHRRWGTDLRSIMSQLASGTEVPIAKMKELERQFITIQNSARQAGKLGLSFFDTIKQGMSKFSYWTSSTFIIMKTVQSIKQMISNVKELNDALTNIKYTMNVTNSQLEKIGYSSLQMAKDLHSSAKNVLDAVKLYANAKESVDSILTKAQASIMMSNVTGFSGETSAKYLQTIMNQFDYTQDDLMMISDTIQTVSQNIAHDFADGIVQINDAISDSGEVARAAGMDLAEYSSIIGVLVENTGLQGSQLGNAMKSIITRTTKAGKILGIDEGDISKAETALRDIGMEVRKSDGEFKEFDNTMAELADRWDNLSQVEQSEISFQLAGTRQTSILKTLLKNWDEVVEITEKANNSSGTTLENQNTYAESLTGKLTELSATWEKIGAETLDSSFLKGLTDIGITVSNLIEKFGLLNTVIVTSIGATGITKFVKSFA